MASEGVFPKSDGDVFYGKDANMTYYQGTFCSTMNYKSVNVSSTATQIIAANSSRKRLLIRNNGTHAVYLGSSSSVTTSNGFELTEGTSILMNNLSAVYGITDSTTEDIRYLEVE